MKKVITTMLVAAMVLSMAMPTSAATITRKKSSGTTASTTKVSGDYSLKMVDKTLQFIRGGKVVSSIETKDGKITLRKSSAGGVSVVFTDANGKRRNITLGAQKTVTLSGTFTQVSVDKALGSSFEVEMEKGSKVTNFYAKGAAKVTLNGSVTTLNVTSSNANVAANGTVSRAYAVNKKSITGMPSGKISQTNTGTSSNGSVNTATKSSNSSNTTVNTDYGSNSSSSGGSDGIIINGGGSNGGTVVTTTAAKEAAKITAAKIGTASVKVGATASEVKAAVEAKAKALVASGYTVTFNQTSAADTSKAGSTSVTGTFTVSKGSDKATTKALTISVNVTEVTVPAEIKSVVAENGLVNIVLTKKPSVDPTDANFKPVIKAYIDGSTTGVDLPGLKFAGYQESSLTVAYTFDKYAATDKDQSIVVGAKLANANEVKADAFKIPATVKAAIANVKAFNGSIEIELVEDPSTEVNAESFAPVIKAYIDDKEVALEDVTFVKYDKATKTVSYTFKEIAPAAKAQSVVIGAKLGDANEVRAEAFIVPSVDDVVEAEIEAVTASNGTANIKLKAAPTNDPTAANFQPVLKAYINDAAEGVALEEVTFVEYDKATATVKLSFKQIAPTNAPQTVKVGAKLGDAAEVQSAPFTIEAATTEIQWTTNLSMPTEGVEGGVLTLSDTPTVLTVEATVEGGVDYKWYKTFASNGTSNAVEIGTGNSYTIEPKDATANAVTYFVVATSTADNTVKSTSDKIKFTKIVVPEDSAITPVITVTGFEKPTIDREFGNQLKPKFTVAVDNITEIEAAGGKLSYQWFDVVVNEDKEEEPVEIVSAKDKDVFEAPVDKTGVHKYYCVITNTNTEASGLTTATATTPKVTVTVAKTLSPVITYEKNIVKVVVKHNITEFDPQKILDQIEVSGYYTKDGKRVDVPVTVADAFYTPNSPVGSTTFELPVSNLQGFIDKDGRVIAGSKLEVKLPASYRDFKFQNGTKTFDVEVKNSETLAVSGFTAVKPAADKETSELIVKFNEALTLALDENDFTVESTKSASNKMQIKAVEMNLAKTEATLTVELPKAEDDEFKLVKAGTAKLGTDPLTVKVVRDTTAPKINDGGAIYRAADKRIELIFSENVVAKDGTTTDFKDEFELNDKDNKAITDVVIQSAILNGANGMNITLAPKTGTDIPVLAEGTTLKYVGTGDPTKASNIVDTAAMPNEFAVGTVITLEGTQVSSKVEAKDVAVSAPKTEEANDSNKPQLANGGYADTPTGNVDKVDLTVSMAQPFIAATASGGEAADLKDIIQVLGSDKNLYKVESATPQAVSAPVLQSLKEGDEAKPKVYNAIKIDVNLPENVTIVSIQFAIDTAKDKVVIKTVANEPIESIPEVKLDEVKPVEKVQAAGTATQKDEKTIVVELSKGTFSDGAKVLANWTFTPATRTEPTIASVVVSGKTATITLPTEEEPASREAAKPTLTIAAAAFAADTTVDAETGLVLIVEDSDLLKAEAAVNGLKESFNPTNDTTDTDLLAAVNGVIKEFTGVTATVTEFKKDVAKESGESGDGKGKITATITLSKAGEEDVVVKFEDEIPAIVKAEITTVTADNTKGTGLITFKGKPTEQPKASDITLKLLKKAAAEAKADEYTEEVDVTFTVGEYGTDKDDNATYTFIFAKVTEAGSYKVSAQLGKDGAVTTTDAFEVKAPESNGDQGGQDASGSSETPKDGETPNNDGSTNGQGGDEQADPAPTVE